MSDKSYGIDFLVVTVNMIRCPKCGRWFVTYNFYRLGEDIVCQECFNLAMNQSSTQSVTQYAEGKQIGGAYQP